MKKLPGHDCVFSLPAASPIQRSRVRSYSDSSMRTVPPTPAPIRHESVDSAYDEGLSALQFKQSHSAVYICGLKIKWRVDDQKLTMKCKKKFQSRQDLMHHRQNCRFRGGSQSSKVVTIFDLILMSQVAALASLCEDLEMDGSVVNAVSRRRLVNDSTEVRKIQEDVMVRRCSVYEVRGSILPIVIPFIDRQVLTDVSIENSFRNANRRQSLTADTIEMSAALELFGNKSTVRKLKKMTKICNRLGIRVQPNLAEEVSARIHVIQNLAVNFEITGSKNCSTYSVMVFRQLARFISCFNRCSVCGFYRAGTPSLS